MRSALALTLGTLAIYASVAWAPFVYEDRNWLDAVNPQSTHGVLPWPDRAPWPNRWLTHASYQFQAMDGQAEPRRYHLVNVLLHLLCGWGVWALSRQMGLTYGAAVFAAAIFLWHPLNTQAVAYVSARSDVLMTLGTLLAVCAALLKRWWAIPIVLVGCWAAGSSKELGAISVVIVLGTLVIASSTRWLQLWVVPVVAMSAAVFLVRWPDFSTWLDLASANVVGLCRVLAMVIVPVGMSIDPDPWMVPLLGRMVAVVCLVIFAIAVARTRTPLVRWAAMWVGLVLLPRVLIPTFEPIHDQHAYLAMVPISVLLGKGLL